MEPKGDRCSQERGHGAKKHQQERHVGVRVAGVKTIDTLGVVRRRAGQIVAATPHDDLPHDEKRHVPHTEYDNIEDHCRNKTGAATRPEVNKEDEQATDEQNGVAHCNCVTPVAPRHPGFIDSVTVAHGTPTEAIADDAHKKEEGNEGGDTAAIARPGEHRLNAVTKHVVLTFFFETIQASPTPV